jgi:hypothetical protein
MADITDHDLILEMRGDMKLLQADVREIKDNQKTQLAHLLAPKESRKQRREWREQKKDCQRF